MSNYDNEMKPLCKGVPMEKALTPSQCEHMREFLAKLIAYPDKKINITEFIEDWRYRNCGT